MQVSFDTASGALSATEVQSSATAPTTLKNIGDDDVADSADTDPILTIPQDISVLAAPTNGMVEANVNNFESKFPRLLLHASLPAAELPVAVAKPFHFQIPLPVSADAGAPAPSMMPSTIPTTFNVWQNAIFDPAKQAWEPQDIPEGGGVASLWPLVVLTKLDTSTSAFGIKAQGDATHPVIVLQGITLLAGDGTGDPTKSDSLFNTATAEAFGSLFNPKSGQPVVFPQDHLTVLAAAGGHLLQHALRPEQPRQAGDARHAAPARRRRPTSRRSAGTAPIVPPSAPLVAADHRAREGLPVSGVPADRPLRDQRRLSRRAGLDGPERVRGVLERRGLDQLQEAHLLDRAAPVLRSQGQRAVVEITADGRPREQQAAARLPADPRQVSTPGGLEGGRPC